MRTLLNTTCLLALLLLNGPEVAAAEDASASMDEISAKLAQDMERISETCSFNNIVAGDALAGGGQSCSKGEPYGETFAIASSAPAAGSGMDWNAYCKGDKACLERAQQALNEMTEFVGKRTTLNLPDDPEEGGEDEPQQRQQAQRAAPIPTPNVLDKVAPTPAPSDGGVVGDWTGPCGSSADCIIEMNRRKGEELKKQQAQQLEKLQKEQALQQQMQTQPPKGSGMPVVPSPTPVPFTIQHR